MVDQSHNLKDKTEEMIQTAVTAQELYTKAALVDRESLARHQERPPWWMPRNALRKRSPPTCGPHPRWRKRTASRGALKPSARAAHLERAAATGRKERAGVTSYA